MQSNAKQAKSVHSTCPEVEHAPLERPHPGAVLGHDELPALAAGHLHEPVVAPGAVEVGASGRERGVCRGACQREGKHQQHICTHQSVSVQEV
jgi:hypothetical protein